MKKRGLNKEEKRNIGLLDNSSLKLDIAGRDISLEEAQEELKEKKEKGAENVIFSGKKDPLLHKDAIRIICYADDLGFNVSVVTDGLSLDTNRINMEILLNSCKVIRFNLGVRSPQSSIGVFLGIIKKIKFLIYGQEKIGCDCLIGTGYLLNKDSATYEEMMRFASLSASMRVDFAQFYPSAEVFPSVDDEIVKIRDNFSHSASQTEIIH